MSPVICNRPPPLTECRYVDMAGPTHHSSVRTISAQALLKSCPPGLSVMLRLRQDRRFYFDRNLATARTRTRSHETRINVRYNCKGSGHMKVFAELIIDGKKRQTRRISAPYCS